MEGYIIHPMLEVQGREDRVRKRREDLKKCKCEY
jgi:hypothetical protein